MSGKMVLANYNRHPHRGVPFNKSPRPPGVDQQQASVGLRSYDRPYAIPTQSPEGLLSPRAVVLPIAALKLASRGI